MQRIMVSGRELNPEQAAAAADQSPTCLVLAGAGTGKTTTLVGRIKHLVSRGAVPESILVISLTNNTVDDFRRVLDSEFFPGFPVSVMTIHALGNRIAGGRPCPPEMRNRILSSIMHQQAREDTEFATALMDWVWAMRDAGSSDICLNGDKIGSRGLRLIGDALFRRQIRFMYRRPELKDGRLTRAYIEIGGRRIFQDDPECRDAARSESFADVIASEFAPASEGMDMCDLASSVLAAWRDRIPESVGALISRCKSTGTTAHMLRDRLVIHPDPTLAGRVELLDRVWDLYTLQCLEKGLTDFDDMVLHATSMADAGRIRSFPFRHVLIDEYQDASSMLTRLVLALRRRFPFDLFCAGDDWQSIYAFTGGDVWQTYGFEDIWKEWPPISVRAIARTYRHCREMADMAARFVMKNPSQTRRSVEAPSSSRFPVQLLPVSSDRDIPGMVANRLELIDPNDSVFVIGRSRTDIRALGPGDGQFLHRGVGPSGSVDVPFRIIDRRTGEARDIRTVRFLTAHSAKGLEADWVFLIADREHGGFPNTLSDPIDNLFETRDEGIAMAEERRVFYVALTRARKGLLIVNMMEDDGYALSSKGDFVSELIADNIRGFSSSTVFCPECTGPMRLTHGKNGLFYGCCGFPRCKGSRTVYGRPFRCHVLILRIMLLRHIQVVLDGYSCL